jgi:NAD(P)-dependent dehydrogenase (short-subunit alcohol dehydrogenase family)
VPLDVTDAAAVEELARATAESFGKIDVWVNNAALTMFARLEDAPVEDIARIIDTNVLGYFYGTRAALPWMREQGRGVIVNVGSILSEMPAPFLAPYVVSKAAGLALSACVRTELRDAPGVKVGTVLPGAIDTPFFHHAANYTGWGLQPLRPTYDPTRVARAVVSCARWPRRKVHVGVLAGMAVWAHRRSSVVTEPIIARMVSKKHFTDEPAPATSGNLYRPDGMAEVSGGWQPNHRTRAVGATAAVGVAAAAAALARRRRAA